MIFQQLNDGPCKTYLIASAGDAMVVDPVLERVNAYLDALAQRALQLRYVLDTHVHADHISGCAALRDRTGADYVMHRRSAAPCVSARVDEGDILDLGELAIRVMHTPGHTQDSVTLVLPDRILTGDFLFIGEGGAGRTDLPGGDAGEHWDSLQKLAALPDDTLVYPAHDYHGRGHSTVGEERRRNPRLADRTRDEYVAWLDTLKLGPATWMADVIKANYACAQDPRAAWIPADQPSCEVKGTAGNVNTELVETIGMAGFRAMLAAGREALVIDVRERDEFDGPLGHIPGARHIPISELASRIDELAALRRPSRQPIVTVCRSGGRSATAAAILTVAGLEDVYSLAGGMLAYDAGDDAVAEPRAAGAEP